VKFIKEYGVYFVLIALLLAGIYWMVIKKNDGIVEKSETEVQAKKETGLTNADGSFRKMMGLSGVVSNWDWQRGVLTVNLDDKIVNDFKISPPQTILMVPVSQNYDDDKSLHILRRANGLHWETAFCEGDTVSLMINENQDVMNVVNTGIRTCGFKGDFE